MAKKKSKPLSSVLHDFSYSFPIFANISSFLLEFWGNFTKPNDPRLPPNKEPSPPSHLDDLMAHILYVLVNGLLLTGAVCLTFSLPLRAEYVLGFGLVRFMLNDLLQQLLWKPLRLVANAIRLR